MRDEEGGNPSTVVVVVVVVALNRDNGGVGRPCWVAVVRRMFAGADAGGEGGLDDDDE